MMEWINGLTWEEKMRRKEKWHKWFAWYPVTIGLTDDGRKIKVWLERIWRKGEYRSHWMGAGWEWEYKTEGE